MEERPSKDEGEKKVCETRSRFHWKNICLIVLVMVVMMMVVMMVTVLMRRKICVNPWRAVEVYLRRPMLPGQTRGASAARLPLKLWSGIWSMIVNAGMLMVILMQRLRV